MKKAALGLILVSFIFAILPILSLLTAAFFAEVLNCSIDESGTSVCMSPIGDVGELLSLMGIAGWFAFYTVPLGFAGMLIGSVLWIIASFHRKKAPVLSEKK